MNQPDKTNSRLEVHGRFEWQTWLLVVVVYAGWLTCLSVYSALGPLPTGVMLVVIGALHLSMQHELLHGHPTRSAMINGLLAYLPISLLFPYPVYRQTHLAHHDNATLTLPGIDPESFYVSNKTWALSGSLARAYYTFNMTAVGRLLCGPTRSAVSLTRSMLRDAISGSATRTAIWLLHLLLVATILYWVDRQFQIPVWHYLIIAYLANSLAMVRSFYEHRAVEPESQRSVIMECGWPFRLLFLNNNYHFVHHEYPAAPWYRLGALYAEHRDAVLKKNGQFIYTGYHSWLLGQLLKPVDSPIHPFANG